MRLGQNSDAEIYATAQALLEANAFADAEAHYRDLLLRHPDNPDLFNKLGWVLRKQGRWLDALMAFRAALSLHADAPGIRANLALVLLQLGAYEAGWQEYEYRLRDAPHLQPELPFPVWQGEAPQGKRFLLVGEQGFGDQIQFARYATHLAAQGAIVDVLVTPPLVRLMAWLPGVRAAYSTLATTSDAYDYQCSLLSMPHRMRTTLATIPQTTPYFVLPATVVKAWQEHMACLTAGRCGLRVGMVWAGGRRPEDKEATAFDARRSLTLAQWLPLLRVSGIIWLSLQLGEPAQELDQLRQEFPESAAHILDLTREINDFADTAALLATLDLVISVDTAVAHLAGALGKPVWILNRHDLCWRWLNERNDSPWYPSARLFRQPAVGDWDSVIANVSIELQSVAAKN